MQVKMDVFVTMLRHPETGLFVPIGANLTEAGAYHVATEAVDAIGMSMHFSPEREQRGAAEIIETIRVVPAQLLIDEELLRV
jgi:hypothetical protein